MAEYAVSLLLEKIASYLIQEAGSLSKDLELRHQVEWIEGELRRMRCFLKDADSQEESDERIKNWVADIRDVSYDTDDFVDSFIFRVAQEGRRSGLVTFLKRYIFFNELISRRKMNNQIKRIRVRLQDISHAKSTYGIGNIGRPREGAESAVSRLHEKRRSSPHVYDDVVGLAEDIRSLESKLVQGELRLSVISVVGMAGVGKTTLAKKVFLSSDVKKHFDCCAWVYVSQEIRAKDTLLDLGKKLTGQENADFRNLRNEELIETISNFLQDKRYLVVLDDMWKCDVWADLKAAFPEKNNGSRIMITTRFKDVARYAEPRSLPHELSPLNDENSCKLFSMKVCSEWESGSSLPPWAEELGKQILKRCGGLPLAIVVLGGLLSRKDATFNEWLKFLQSLHWQLSQDPMHCEEILAMSYRDLPYYLKSCFLYFALFPEDFEISARRLILLWVAEGFVLPRGQEPLEDVAEDYLEELVGRSMVQVAKRKSNGKIKSCQVHDLLRELAISKAKEDQFLDVIHGELHVDYPSGGRRLAFHSGVLPTTKNTQKILRSLLCFDLSETSLGQLKKFQLLRVLDLEGICLTQLDSAIGNLIHLRYLGLRGTWLKKLPSSLQYLMNLQTLDLRSTLINPIPAPIWNLLYLRNLHFSELKETTINPPTNASLTYLQSLRGICIGQKTQVEHGLDKLTSIRDLELHGELCTHEAALANWILMSKNLEYLKLNSRTTVIDAVERLERTWNAVPTSMMLANHFCLSKLHFKGFIKRLYDVEQFPPNLTELSLQDSYLMEDPMPKLEKLKNLRLLKLKQSSYVGRELVCSNGGFPQLHFLKLSFLALETWRIEDGAFPNLKQLEITGCKKLKIVPRGLQPVTSLRDLKLGCLPHEFKLKVRDRQGENWYRIHQVLPI